MKPLLRSVLDAYLASHYGVISRTQALELGVSPWQIDHRVRHGSWRLMHRGIYQVAAHADGPEARLLAGCLVGGVSAVASHRSAGWLWGLLPSPPTRPAITVPRERRPSWAEVEWHRRDDVDPQRVLVHRGVPVTDPLRTVADLGEAVPGACLEDVIDRGVATRLFTVAALEAEVGRLSRQGRRGVPALRDALARRGLTGAPDPSVLESRLLRLLRRWGITPAGTEVVVCDGRYRIDVQLVPGLALEVDGYAYHWSPEAKSADSRRRNQLRHAGIRVIEADWVTVMHDPESLRTTIEAALGQQARAGTATGMGIGAASGGGGVSR
ncbi:MAG TPA: type IV toxin-antitoxin system AbiEi family antitoxin domain-containing protein [Acidimicrobiales bacterium]|nr:type IV toxin-antitoxin system AbiEi family antitoxin domain-containing protein [Acidimicrobiales bacterium]